MKDSRLTKNVLKLAFNAESVEELESKLQEAEIQHTEEETKKLFDNVMKEKIHALDDEELEAVSGGCGRVKS